MDCIECRMLKRQELQRRINGRSFDNDAYISPPDIINTFWRDKLCSQKTLRIFKNTFLTKVKRNWNSSFLSYIIIVLIYDKKLEFQFQLLVVYHYCLDFACLALWSFMTAFRDRLIRPWLSISITFTIISSPMETTSSTLFVLFSSNSDMWTSPSFPLNNSTKAPNFSIRFTVPRYISPTSTSRTMSSIMLFALSFISASLDEIYTLPSCSISILTPVSSMISLICFPLGPMTSRIFSGSISIVKIFGA